MNPIQRNCRAFPGTERIDTLATSLTRCMPVVSTFLCLLSRTCFWLNSENKLGLFGRFFWLNVTETIEFRDKLGLFGRCLPCFQGYSSFFSSFVLIMLDVFLFSKRCFWLDVNKTLGFRDKFGLFYRCFLQYLEGHFLCHFW